MARRSARTAHVQNSGRTHSALTPADALHTPSAAARSRTKDAPRGPSVGAHEREHEKAHGEDDETIEDQTRQNRRRQEGASDRFSRHDMNECLSQLSSFHRAVHTNARFVQRLTSSRERVDSSRDETLTHSREVFSVTSDVRDGTGTGSGTRSRYALCDSS